MAGGRQNRADVSPAGNTVESEQFLPGKHFRRFPSPVIYTIDNVYPVQSSNGVFFFIIGTGNLSQVTAIRIHDPQLGVGTTAAINRRSFIVGVKHDSPSVRG